MNSFYSERETINRIILDTGLRKKGYLFLEIFLVDREKLNLFLEIFSVGVCT